MVSIVLRSVGSEHGSASQMQQLYWEVVVETALCKDVVLFLGQPESHFLHFILLQLDICQRQPSVQAWLVWLPYWISSLLSWDRLAGVAEQSKGAVDIDRTKKTAAVKISTVF